MVGMNESIHLTSEHLVDASPSFEEFVENHHARLYGALCLQTGDRQELREVAISSASSEAANVSSGSSR